MNTKYLVLVSLIIASLGLMGMAPAQQPPAPTPTSKPTPTPSKSPTPPAADPSGLNSTYNAIAHKVALSYPQVPQTALKRALKYVQDNPNSVPNKDFVTIVDFN